MPLPPVLPELRVEGRAVQVWLNPEGDTLAVVPLPDLQLSFEGPTGDTVTVTREGDYCFWLLVPIRCNEQVLVPERGVFGEVATDAEGSFAVQLEAEFSCDAVVRTTGHPRGRFMNAGYTNDQQVYGVRVTGAPAECRPDGRTVTAQTMYFTWVGGPGECNDASRYCLPAEVPVAAR